MMALRTPSLEGASRLQGSTLGCNPGSPAGVSRCGPWSEPLSSWRLGSATPAGESSPPPPGTSFTLPRLPAETGGWRSRALAVLLAERA